MREHSAKARESVQRFDAVAGTRISWLVKLIVGLAPQSDELAAFRFLHARYWLSTRACTLFKLPYDNFDHEEYVELFEAGGPSRYACSTQLAMPDWWYLARRMS